MKRCSVLFILLYVAVVLVNAETVFSAEEKNEMTQEKLAKEIAGFSGIDKDKNFSEISQKLSEKGIEPKGGWDSEKPVPEEEVRRLLKYAIFGTIKQIIPEKKIVLVKKEGETWKRAKGSDSWVRCEEGEEFNLGDSVKTEGNATLGWGNMAVIKAPQSEFIIEDDKKLFLKSGSVYVDAEKKSELKVITPTTVAAVRGTIYVVSVGEGSKDLVRGRTE